MSFNTNLKSGLFLEEMTWLEAESVLQANTIVLIPLGAAAKEHGPHLKLNNDFQMASYLSKKIAELCSVVITPCVTYGYYPAFVEYPGSISLRLETARDMIIDICTSLHKFGPRKFYVLNTGISTLKALGPAAEALEVEGIVLKYTNLAEVLDPVEKVICKQDAGSHADEAETSMMLVINESSVDMTKAVKDCDLHGSGPLTRQKDRGGTYSSTGIWGDPTLADKDKGEALLSALIKGIKADLDDLRLVK
jgi:creatinine amidohydrolase